MIIEQMFVKPVFVDRYKENNNDGVDVIIPLKTVNCLFERNLLSWYKEIPIHCLWIGDSGIDKEVLSVLCRFPRMVIIDQSKFKTLGFCIKDLIECVMTDSFVYLHADAFLPMYWYDVMKGHMKGMMYDWVESGAVTVLMAEYIDGYEDNAERAFSGAQLGNAALLRNAVSGIQDDFVYRNEDIIIRELVEAHGGSYGRVKQNRYYHEQVYENKGDVHSISVSKDINRDKEVTMLLQQIHGIIKYCPRMKMYLWKILLACFLRLIKIRVKGEGNKNEL
jgi:hypothetical protein